MNFEERIEKIEKWMSTNMTQELREDLWHHYQLDKYTLNSLFSDEEIQYLSPEKSELKMEMYKPLHKKQANLRFRFSVFTENGMLLLSRNMPYTLLSKSPYGEDYSI